MHKLKKSFESYLNVAKSILAKRSKGDRAKRGLYLHTNEPFILKTLVSKSEKQSSFSKLIEDSRSEFKIDAGLDTGYPILNPALEDAVLNYAQVMDLSPDYYVCLSEYPDEAIEIVISNFFCRSGCYLNIFKEIVLDTDTLFEEYCSAFNKREFKERYLIPLGNVEFSGSSMNFDKFQIKKFSLEELSNILNSDINNVFYQYASFKLERLIRFWYVYIERTIDPIEGYGKELEQSFSYHSYGVYPKSLETILQNIALYDWESKHKADAQRSMMFLKKLMEEVHQEKSENTFEEVFNPNIRIYKTSKLLIPFNLVINDNLLSHPQLPVMHGQFNMDRDFQVYMDWNPESYHFFQFDNEQSNKFEDFLKNNINLLDKIKNRKEERGFINHALEQFNKAFFSEMSEELLAHIITIECLLGDKNEEGFRRTLTQRITKILGKTEKEKKFIRKEFNDLYTTRSHLVHGIRIEKERLRESSVVARDMARKVVLRFLKVLEDKDIRRREDVLKYIDLS